MIFGAIITFLVKQLWEYCSVTNNNRNVPFPPQNNPPLYYSHRTINTYSIEANVVTQSPLKMCKFFFAERRRVKIFHSIRKNYMGLDSIKNGLLMLPFKVGCVTVPTILRCAGWWWVCCCNNDGQHWHDFHEVERDPQDVVSASPCSGIWLFFILATAVLLLYSEAGALPLYYSPFIF